VSHSDRRWLSPLVVITAILAPALAVPTPARASGNAITYTYEVRGLANSSNLGDFAILAAQTYYDVRGWNLGGTIEFHRVASGGNFTLWLARADQVPSFGSPCDSGYSCRSGRNVVINESRWLHATDSWNAAGGSLRDYRHMVINHETGHWLGFGHAYCPGPGQAAPVMQQQSISLQGCHFSAWPSGAERQTLANWRGVAIRNGDPVGNLDSVTPRFVAVSARGWGIDPNNKAATRVWLYLDSEGPRGFDANLVRADVQRLMPAYGASHGYDVAVAARPGPHKVCTRIPNLSGPGAMTKLGCRTVTVSGTPGGHLERVLVSSMRIEVIGWLIDPDTSAAARVNVRVDSVPRGFDASLRRDDIAARFPQFGPYHGFHTSFAATAGPHRVCGFGLNTAGTGSTLVMECRTVTVPA